MQDTHTGVLLYVRYYYITGLSDKDESSSDEEDDVEDDVFV